MFKAKAGDFIEIGGWQGPPMPQRILVWGVVWRRERVEAVPKLRTALGMPGILFYLTARVQGLGQQFLTDGPPNSNSKASKRSSRRCGLIAGPQTLAGARPLAGSWTAESLRHLSALEAFFVWTGSKACRFTACSRFGEGSSPPIWRGV